MLKNSVEFYEATVLTTVMPYFLFYFNRTNTNSQTTQDKFFNGSVCTHFAELATADNRTFALARFFAATPTVSLVMTRFFVFFYFKTERT